MSQFKHSHEVAWKGDILVEQGQAQPLLFTLYSGMAVKSRELLSGKSQLLSLVLPGEMVGIETMHGLVASSTVQAITDVTFCKLNPEGWFDLLKVPSIRSRLIERMVLDQRELEDRLAAVGASPAEGALAHFLISLYDQLWARKLCREDSFRLPLTNKQIANAVGVSTVHLNRVMARLRIADVLSLDEHRVTIHSMTKLRKIAALPARSGDRPLL